MAGNKDAKRVIILDGKNQKKEDKGSGSLNGSGAVPGGISRQRPVQGDGMPATEEDDHYPHDDASGTVEGLHRPGTVSRRHSGKRRLLFILFISAAILATLIFTAARTVNNNYETPVKIYEEYLNKPEYTGEEMSEAYANRAAEKELKKLRELLGQYEDYKASIEASLLKSREIYNNNREKYGDDFHYTVTVDSTQRLSSLQVAALQTELNGILNDINASTLVQAGDTGLKEAVNEVTSALRQPGISGGYRLECTKRVVGTMPDGSVSDVREHPEFIVVRLDGRWIMWDGIYDILKMLY